MPVPVPELPLGAGVGSRDIVPLIALPPEPEPELALKLLAVPSSVSVPVSRSVADPMPFDVLKAPLEPVSNGGGTITPVVSLPIVVLPLKAPRLAVGSDPVVAGPRLVGVPMFDGSGSIGTLSAGPPVAGAPLLFSWKP
jgi:hypothetical protein